MKTNANKNLYFLQIGIFFLANFKETNKVHSNRAGTYSREEH